MEIALNLNNLDDYRLFLRIKSLPKYRIVGRTAIVPDEYAGRLGSHTPVSVGPVEYEASSFLFDYQEGVSRIAIRKQKFGGFIECGLGKTLIMFEFLRHASRCLAEGKALLIVSPLMVIRQTLDEATRFYGDSLPIEQVKAAHLPFWLQLGAGRIGITNYEALDPSVPQGRLGALVLDESSMLKSMYGKWGQECIRLGAGLEWKLALTGTPAPNDRVEYANHAVFLDAFPTANAFLAKFFVNRGQTDNRWEIKPHAVEPFYRALSDWSIFLSDPATYGWEDNSGGVPPIHIHIEDVGLTAEQQALAYKDSGTLFPMEPGGITSRSVLSQIAKGSHKGKAIDSLKSAHIRKLVDAYPRESIVIWCQFNHEQAALHKLIPEAGNIDGSTPIPVREEIISHFQAGKRRILISKAKILGFGLNLQIATRHIFSGLQDSYEGFHQAVKRSNRYGSSQPLHVHIPVTEIERPMIETVLKKADRVRQDTAEQERIFRHASA